MKIAIDISQSIYGTGVSWYTRSLVENLLTLDDQNEYLLFGGSLRRLDELRKFAKGKYYPIPPSLADLIWNRLHVLPIENLIGEVDVFHSSDWTQPPSKAFKVTTVHDLAPLKFPKETPRMVVEVHTRRLKWVKKEVNRIIVPSLAVKKELIEEGFNKERIRVIYEAPRKIFKPTNKRVLKEDYLLAIGVGGRKNTKRIIKAAKGFKLVVVGRKHEEVVSQEGVEYVGVISDEKLAALYSGARALVYPSLYEGFGLPILEAFACDCPVVTSYTGSMAEIAGGAAILVDPEDVSSIAQGIVRAVSKRRYYVSKGQKRAKDFSWKRAAEETLKVYNEVASSASKEGEKR